MTLRLLPVAGDFLKFSRMSGKDFELRFQSPLLRQVWHSAWLPEFSSLFLLMTLALLHKKQAGYVIGGSMKVSRALEKRYLDLGGKISYKSRISKILVEHDRAVGVKLQDGIEHRADYVVSAADGHATIFDLLDGKYVDDRILGYYRTLPIFQPLIYIGLGVNRRFTDVPESVSGLIMELQSPVVIAGTERRCLQVHVHNSDPSLAPVGKTVLTVMMESSYEYWAKLYEDRTLYNAEKDAISNTVIEQLEKRFPGFKSQVEMIDVATPVTFRRYTGNWQGSFEGWQMTPEMVTLTMKKTLPGLDNFYMSGQWVQPGGGIPSGAMTGRYVVQMLCKRDRIKFEGRKPETMI
jgi:phytoene dehydrogenase-like protein